MAISYRGRTYEEGKKITWKDGVRALYCIFHYNSGNLPLPIQFLVYLMIGGAAAIVNLISFLVLLTLGVSLVPSTGLSFALAAVVNYFLCIAFLFRHKERWNSTVEVLMYLAVVAALGFVDMGSTRAFYVLGAAPWFAKSLSSLFGLFFNFIGRRLIVFPKSTKDTSSDAFP